MTNDIALALDILSFKYITKADTVDLEDCQIKSIENDFRAGFTAAHDLMEKEASKFRQSECEAHIHEDPAKRLTHERYLVKALSKTQSLQKENAEFKEDLRVKELYNKKQFARFLSADEKCKELKAQLAIAVEGLDKIEKTECSSIVGKRWCCQFRQWALDTRAKINQKPVAVVEVNCNKVDGHEGQWVAVTCEVKKDVAKGTLIIWEKEQKNENP